MRASETPLSTNNNSVSMFETLLLCYNESQKEDEDMQKTSILLMHCKEMEKQQKIRKLCQRFGMECRMLTEKDGKEELGVLCATYPVAVGKHEMPPFAWQMPELLVFSGLQENSLQLFLAAYRETQIEQIPLKAIVTPHNISWSIYELSRELASEHAAMHP